MCVERRYSSTSTRKQKDGVMLPYAHIWSRDGSTWEESVNCQCGDIKPSYIKQFMKPLMMQTLYLRHMTWETQNIIFTFILSDKKN